MQNQQTNKKAPVISTKALEKVPKNEYDDALDDEESPNEYEHCYRDGTLANECWREE